LPLDRLYWFDIDKEIYMKKVFKVYVYNYGHYFEAEVEGITMGTFGSNSPEIKDEPAVFIHDTKEGVISEIIDILRSFGHSGFLRIV